jgi:hypothetical protein
LGCADAHRSIDAQRARLHWQISGLLALEDAVDVAGRAPELVDDTGT